MRCLKKYKAILAVLLLLLTSLLAISGSMSIIQTVETFFELHSHEHSHENGNISHHHSFDFKMPEVTSISQPVNKNLMEYKEAWKNLEKRADGHLSGEGYTHVGHPNESEIINDMGPNNTPENLWKANSNFVQTFLKKPEGDNRTGPDGGWTYTIDDVTHESGYLSIVYFKIPNENKKNGRFYHGPRIYGQTLKTDGTPIKYEYFASGKPLSKFNIDEWYVSIGTILPYKEGGYLPVPETIGGIYNLSTGEKIMTNKNFMMKPGITKQNHRTFQFYSNDSNSEILFARPGFYKMDGSEPTLEDILNLQNID
jgi:hypothetical protein